MKKNGKIYWRIKIASLYLDVNTPDVFSLENISNTFRKNFSKKMLTQNMFVMNKNSQIIRKCYWNNKNKQENIKIWKKEVRRSYYLHCTKIWVTSPTFNFFSSWIKQSQTISTSGMEYDKKILQINKQRINCWKGNLFENLLNHSHIMQL